MKQLPLKARILDYALKKGGTFRIDEVVQALCEEYKGERFCNPKHIEHYVYAYIGVGVMQGVDFQLDVNGNLVVDYGVTDFGKEYEKLIPKE